MTYDMDAINAQLDHWRKHCWPQITLLNLELGQEPRALLKGGMRHNPPAHVMHYSLLAKSRHPLPPGNVEANRAHLEQAGYLNPLPSPEGLLQALQGIEEDAFQNFAAGSQSNVWTLARWSPWALIHPTYFWMVTYGLTDRYGHDYEPPLVRNVAPLIAS